MTPTQLLVSVVNRAEACIALTAGADLIDIKDPRKGSLGAADAATIKEVVTALRGTATISVALGELNALKNGEGLTSLEGVAFAKLGLAGCARSTDWPVRWGGWLRMLPRQVKPVAVAYADWRQSASPKPGQVLVEAARLGCAAVLVDTCDKSQGGLLDYWQIDSLAEFTTMVQRRGMLAVLGGSLSIETIPSIAALKPDYVAVRGAACEGGRIGPLCPSRVRRLARLVATAGDPD